jgi:TctA family transporter
MIMLAGIYYGAQYGGSTTAILVNLPGESSSAVTAIDGYQMARQGRAGPALATSACASPAVTSAFPSQVSYWATLLWCGPAAQASSSHLQRVKRALL